jgi:hypothetical protein
MSRREVATLLLPDIVDSFFPKDDVSTKAGQAQLGKNETPASGRLQD